MDQIGKTAHDSEVFDGVTCLIILNGRVEESLPCDTLDVILWYSWVAGAARATSYITVISLVNIKLTGPTLSVNLFTLVDSTWFRRRVKATW